MLLEKSTTSLILKSYLLIKLHPLIRGRKGKRKMKNNTLNQFFGVDGIEKVTVNENSNIYKKEAFNAFMVEQFPQYAENGVIPPSKYENVAKKTRKVLRTMLLQIFEMFAKQKTKEAQKKFAIQFAKFYQQFYIVNDYTLASVTNGRLKVDSQQIIQTYLPQLKMLLEEQKVKK